MAGKSKTDRKGTQVSGLQKAYDTVVNVDTEELADALVDYPDTLTYLLLGHAADNPQLAFQLENREEGNE